MPKSIISVLNVSDDSILFYVSEVVEYRQDIYFWLSGRPLLIASYASSITSDSSLSLVSIGGCTTTFMNLPAGLTGAKAQTGMASWVPTRDTGTILAPVRRAILKAPLLRRRSGGSLPSFDLVPSGKVARETPRSSQETPSRKAFIWDFLSSLARSTCSPHFRDCPMKGTFSISALDTNLYLWGSMEMMMMSTHEQWLATNITGSSAGGMFSRPSIWGMERDALSTALAHHLEHWSNLSLFSSHFLPLSMERILTPTSPSPQGMACTMACTMNATPHRLMDFPRRFCLACTAFFTFS
mmetsp:Transcript_7435/g.11216  ORF Transcript_7435/g.11216 Transcript_7435/m.11216 type:complete len:297 (+) Transcript_7435:60-950(+)